MEFRYMIIFSTDTHIFLPINKHLLQLMSNHQCIDIKFILSVPTCDGTRAPPKEAKPRRMIGTQQKKSVITITVIRLAMAVSDLDSVLRTAFLVCLATKNMRRYEKKITKNERKFNTRNTATEYSHPFGFELVMWNARHTPERP